MAFQEIARDQSVEGSAHAASANSITVDGLALTFANGHIGLQSTHLHVPGGQFCTLLGPSGSGKTTLLRAIAGLAKPTAGRIRIGSTDVTELDVQARNIGFVFQNYALFPHMNVGENIEYPLKLHKWSEADRSARVKEILELIELPHAGRRMVGELSGGQQQRVAIGRALAYRPALLLLDEPMGALDRRLRQQLGADLREIQQRAGITAMYVTHDQEEAFILSDRIAIMASGVIQQYAAPSELYFRPRTRFVADFLGEANLVEVTAPLTATPSGFEAATAYGPVFVDEEASPDGVSKPTLVVRPEDIVLKTDGTEQEGHVRPVPVEIVRELFLGSRCLVTARAPTGQEFWVECAKSRPAHGDSGFWISWAHSAAVLVDE
jgi:putative spermidine/putrescine transport system ATP-binding protein